MQTISLSERIAAFAEHCRQDNVPAALISAISEYLAGQGSLATVRSHWQQAYAKAPFVRRDLLSTAAAPCASALDDFDYRLLDILHDTNMLQWNIGAYLHENLVEQTRTHLLARGLSEADFLDICMNQAGMAILMHDAGSGLFKLFSSYIPDRFDELLQSIVRTKQGNAGVAIMQLLLDQQPPQIDLAWQMAQQLAAHNNGWTGSGWTGEAVTLLLATDSARFTPWARELAGPSNSQQPVTRYETLVALLVHNSRAHYDLAITALRETPALQWGYFNLQRNVLDTLGDHLPPAEYADLAADLLLSPDAELGRKALALIELLPFAQIEAPLHHCIAEGQVEVARQALMIICKQQPAGLPEYLRDLMSHRSKQIREQALKQLLKQGEVAVDLAAPLLEHRSADTRLAAVELLRRSDSPRTAELLGARLDAERSAKVRQAILDAGGTPPEATTAGSDADPRAALAHKAALTIKRIKLPLLAWFDPSTQILRWNDGTPLSTELINYILYRASRQKSLQPDAALHKILADLERRDAADWVLLLWQGWLGNGADARSAWLLDLISALGDDRLVPLLRSQIESWVAGNRGAVAGRAAQALGILGSDLALSELDNLAVRIKHAQVRSAAQAALANAARRAGISREELADRIVPSLGFDPQGEQMLDYGPRRFVARLTSDLSLQLRDENGKPLKSLPKPNSQDDAQLAEKAQEGWKQIKAGLKQVLKSQTARLERDLVNQRAWPLERWQQLFLHHPLLRGFATRLLWRADSEGTTLLFRPLEDGSLSDANDEPVDLPVAASIRMAHPVELSPDSLAAWQNHFADYEIAQPFAQLNRPLLSLEPEEREQIFWTRYHGYMLNGGALKGRMIKAGWERGAIGDGGAYFTLHKPFPQAGIVAVLETAGLAIGIEQEFETALKQLAFRRSTARDSRHWPDEIQPDDPQALRLGDVPALIFSEAAADVQNFAAAGAYDPDWERKVW
jgi:hypothetical protein